MYLFKRSYCGYNNVTSFETIDENDIREVEKFVREELLDFLKTNASSTNADQNSLGKQQMIDHFGEFYAHCPSKFRFLPGDRKFIQNIQKHVHYIVNEKGPKKAFKHFSNKINGTELTKHTNDKVKKCDEMESSEFTDNGLKTKLYSLILDKLNELGVPLSTTTAFNESFISIANKNDKITGNVICIVCHLQSEDIENVRPKQVYCRGKSWVISNFISHFTRAHPQFTLNKNNKSDQPDNENEMSEKKVDECVSTEYIAVEEIDPLTYEMNFSTESLEIFIANEISEMERKFNNQISNQLIKMWNAVTQYGEIQDQQVKSLCENGVSVSLDVARILQNGDCLYGSVAHQIFRHDLNSAQHRLATQNLRTEVVSYINQNYQEFKQHLRGHVLELEEIGRAESYGLHEFDNIDDKCKHLLNNKLINSGVWAAGESLKAIACLHDVNIIVFYENGPICCVHKSGQLSEQTVVIAYRFLNDESEYRNHYDSVCNISAPEIYITAKFISEILSQDSNLKIDLATSP